MSQEQRYGGPGAHEPGGQAHPGGRSAVPPEKAARTVGDEARGLAGDVGREAGKAGETVGAEARRLGSAARDRIESTAEAQKDRLAGRISGVAEQVGRSADGLRDREAWLAELVDAGARELGDIAASLKSHDMESILQAVERFGRRQPALFAGASVALGFALGRAANAATGRGGESAGETRETGPDIRRGEPWRARSPATSGPGPAGTGAADGATGAEGPDHIHGNGRIG